MQRLSRSYQSNLALGMFMLFTFGMAPVYALDDSQIIPGAKRINHVSQGALKGACQRSGGTYLETPDEYLCATDNSWVYCEKKSGDCVGGNGDGKEQKKRMSQPKLSHSISGNKLKR